MKPDDNHLLNEDEKLVKNLMSHMVVSPTEDMKEHSFQLSLMELNKTRQKKGQRWTSLRWLKATGVGIAIVLLAIYLPHTIGGSNHSSSSSSSNMSKQSASEYTASDSATTKAAKPKDNQKNGHTEMKSAGLTAHSLDIGHVTIGDSYGKLIDRFGKPVNAVGTKGNMKKLFYIQQGAGIIVQTNEDDIIKQLRFNLKYLSPKQVAAIPKTKQSVVTVYGLPSSTNVVTCYETATCQEMIYKQAGNQLVVRLNHDGKTVDMMTLNGH